MKTELIIFGRCILKDGTKFPIYYIHKFEDDKAAICIDDNKFVTLAEPYSSIKNWRNKRDLLVHERT